MALELTNQLVVYLVSVAEDVFVKVRKFSFLAEFVVVDYDVDSRVPLILRRPFLRTARELIDIHGEELTLRVNDEAVMFKIARRVAIPLLRILSLLLLPPSFTPFEGSDFILEEIETFLHTLDELSTLDDDFDSEEDIALIEKLLNEVSSSNLPPIKNESLKQVDATMTKPLIKEPPELELKHLSSHLEYAFLDGTNKLPVKISKELKDEEKVALLKDDFKLVVQHQRRVSLKIHEVIKKEVIKLLDAGFIFPISDSSWVSPVHYVPKKGGMTVVKNEDNELIPTRLVTGWLFVLITDIFKFELTRKTNRKPPSLALMGRFLTDACLLAYVMLRACSKEKCRFMVKEGIFLGYKSSKSGIEVDRAKVDAIAKLPNPTSVEGAVLGQRKTKHFQPINYASKTMTDAQAHYTTTEKELLAVVYAFEKFWPYLVLSKTIMYTDHSAFKYLIAKLDC
nr:DNA-directed DNA polymerase [Tanacetum cinerariifolium]